MTAQTTEAPAPVVLPRVPSQLIRIALEDIEKAEKAENVEIDMDLAWHWPVDDGRCSVCLAGAVMRERLRVSDDEDASPTVVRFGENADPLHALNALRLGRVAHAFADLGFAGDEIDAAGKFDRAITYYDRDPAAFKADMRRLASDLERAGY